MDTRPPLWLLDVDGVLNAIPVKSSGRPDRSTWPDWTLSSAPAGGETWPIWFSPTVTAFVRDAHESKRAEIRWLTTWGDDANGPLRDLFGLPELAVVASPPTDVAGPAGEDTAWGVDWLPGDPWWKFDAVEALATADPDRRFVWTDDDLRWNTYAQTWCRQNTLSMLIGPKPHLGLTPRLLRAIEAFLDPTI